MSLVPFRSILPTPRTPDPKAAPPQNRAGDGPGQIVERFLQALRDGTRQNIIAASSRAKTRAAASATKWGMLKGDGELAGLAANPQTDVATPHNQHLPAVLAVIEGGKHVLVDAHLAACFAEGRVEAPIHPLGWTSAALRRVRLGIAVLTER